MTSIATIALLACLLGSTGLVLLAMSFLFAQLVGWRSLVRLYGAKSGNGERFSSKGVVLGAQSWNGPPLCVVLDERGITLVPKPAFRPAFASFLIPWRLVQSFEKRSYLFFDVVELRFGTDTTSLIGFVPSKATEAITSYLTAYAGAATRC